MKRRTLTLAAFVAVFAMVFAPAATAQDVTDGLTSSVTGAVTDTATGDVLGDFVGDLTITGITRDGRDLVFEGLLNGAVVDDEGNPVLDAAGNPLEVVDEVVEFAAGLTPGGEGNGNPRCDILFLDLGPLHLDLLGLVVDLSDVQLDIHAVPGAGNLLGNLLCAVAGLLDGPGLGGGILNAVDRILDRVTGILDDLLG